MYRQVIFDKRKNNKILPPISVQQKRKRNRGRKKRNLSNTLIRDNDKNLKLAMGMSSWAENFTVAATWQLKHQVAQLQSKVRALQYENNVLHEVIRGHNYNTSSKLPCEIKQDDSGVETSQEPSVAESIKNEGLEEQCHESDSELEVSEEYIQFLKNNFKFKEDARMEREKLKAKFMQNEKVDEIDSEPPVTVESHRANMNELYGVDWRKIMALEMSLKADYITEIDNDDDVFWPNIPLNFKFV